ncbi:MAG: phosphoribosylformylglycinamidine synthase subunit PurQ [Solirubrobacterales bacterium]
MATRFGIPQFPGSCDEVDTLLAASRVGDAELLWHKDRDLKGVDVVIVPGGFSYGDYLRVGAIPGFSPVMQAVAEHAAEGGLVLGICNGFQVLTEMGLLPGALLPNANLHFTFRQLDIEVVNTETPFTHECAPGEILSIPAKHTTGRYFAPPEMLEQIEADGQVLLRYADGQNFNGSLNDIAGVCNAQRNVFGLMPHPEHAVDPLTGSDDGLKLFASLASAAPMALATGDAT